MEIYCINLYVLLLPYMSSNYSQICNWCILTSVKSPCQDEDAPLVTEEEEDLFIIDQSVQDFLEVKRAEYMGYSKRVQWENQLLFTPSFLTGTMVI